MLRNRCTLHARELNLSSLNPITSCNTSRLSFLKLPREIRDQIYTLALASESSIVAWEGEWRNDRFDEADAEDFETSDDATRSSMNYGFTELRWRHIEGKAIIDSVRSLSTNILLCNNTVGREAAHIFYSKNTFSFLGHHEWGDIALWLNKIGPINQSSITSIEIDAYRPHIYWSSRLNGDSISSDGLSIPEIFPPHPYFQVPVPELPSDRYVFESISPAVESVFKLLGNTPPGQKVAISMLIRQGEYPGARTSLSNVKTYYINESVGFSMNLPNLIERSRSLHAPQMEVLWSGIGCRIELEEQMGEMERLGWDVELLPALSDELRRTERWHNWHRCHRQPGEYRFAKFVLRRQEIVGPLISCYHYCTRHSRAWDEEYMRRAFQALPFWDDSESSETDFDSDVS